MPVDSGMGVEDWESKYKVPDSGVLDDYLNIEQKMWEDEDKSIIYRISDSPCGSKCSRFYQTVECDVLSPEGTEDPNGRAHTQNHSFSSGEVRLVYKEAGSFEDESSPPEIDIIPSVKQLRKQTDREGLLYKTRLWAKTALEDTLESYAAFREEEAAREEAARVRESYGSIGSDEMQFSFGSEEELDDLTFTEGDASYEYDSYYPGKYMSPFEGQGYTSKETSFGQDPMFSLVEEPSDEYIDPMDELQSLVDSVSEYLAVKEEEINYYESIPKPIRRKLPPLPSDARVVQPEPEDPKSKDVSPEVKEDSAVEQGIAGVKNAMSSLFNTITGSKSTTDVEASGTCSSPQPPQADSGISKLLSLIPKASAQHIENSGTAATDPPTAPSLPQPESSISKLLSFIPKSGGTSPPVAVVPPAFQEPMAEKKFSLQSLFRSSEPNPQTDADQASANADTEAPGSASTAHQSTSGFESMLGRLSPLRLFSSAPPSRVPSPQPPEERSVSAASNESQPESVNITSFNREAEETEPQTSGEIRTGSGSGSVDLFSEPEGGSIELLQETESGSVELLPETESSGELPDIQQRRSPISEPKPESTSEETGFFSPFKKSFSNLISTVPPETSLHTETKPAEESFLGSKLKIPFLSSENIPTAAPKAEGSMLTGILKFASGEDVNTPTNNPSPSPTRTPSPNRTTLLESVPKGNKETGWFSNLFKVAPNEPTQQTKTQIPPTVILTKPSGQTEPQKGEMPPETTESTVCRAESAQEKTMSDIQCKIGSVQSDADKNQGLPKPVEQSRSQPQSQGLLSGLLKLESSEEDSHSQQGGGIFSSLFSSPSQTSPKAHLNAATQQSSGLLSGFLKLASENNSGSANESALPGGQSDPIPTQTQEHHTVVQPPSGFLSGLLKKATDTVTGSQARQSSHESQPDVTDRTVETGGLEQNFNQGSAPSTQSAGILSGLVKFGSKDAPPDKEQPDQQLRQPVASDQQSQQQQNIDQLTEELPPRATASPNGLFGGLLKLTETTQPAKGPLSAQPNQQPGSMLSGLFSKIVDPNPPPSQLQSEPIAQEITPKPAHHASPQQGGFFSGIFGIGGQDSAAVKPAQVSQNPQQSSPSGRQGNQLPGNRQNLQRQNQVPPQQPPSGPGGMFTGLFNKIADSATQSAVQNEPEQHSNQQGGFLSGLFSSGSTHPTQQQPPVSHPNQHQTQGNRQPLRRQSQIPPHPTSAPEPQQGGLFSGLFNKLASADNGPPQPTTQTAMQQDNKTSKQGQSANQHLSQPSQQGGFLSSLFGQTSPQQQQQPDKMASSQPTVTQQPNQSGGLLSGFLKLASGENVPQEQQSSQPSQTDQPSVKSVQNTAQTESGGLFSGLLNKISGAMEQPSTPSDHVTLQTTEHQQQPRAGQERPQIQRTKPVEIHSSQDVDTDKDLKAPAYKCYSFSVTEDPSSKEQNQLTSQPAKEDPKTSTSSKPQSLLSSIFKTGPSVASSSTLVKGSHDNLDHTTKVPSSAAVVETSKKPLPSQIWKEPTISPTQRYLEEIQGLLYGTAGEYGYKDLLYNFAEHGVIQPELYEHQCLIEALLWQQLNDYALAEALDNQVPECYQPCQYDRPPTVSAPQWENSNSFNPREIDISHFNIPSHPWKDPASQLFESRNRFFEPDEDLVLFDMSSREKKAWSSCDHLNDLDRNRKPWIAGGSALNLSMEKPKTRINRCQSLTECSVREFSKKLYKGAVCSDVKDELKSATEFLKRLATKKGPMDLTRGAVDLSKSAGDLDDEMLFEDSEWYQQWLSLLEQGMWWPAEAGDCGYYVYTDEDYIYSLLTDRAGSHLYACAAPEFVQTLQNITENIANIVKQKERDKVTLYGFKIPLCTEDKGLNDSTIPRLQQNKPVLSDTPTDLTSALRKGEKIMNMNLERFSQMFEESMSSQAEQPVDFSVYKLQKIKVESVHNTNSCEEKPMEAADFTLVSLKGAHGGPYWKNKGVEDVFMTSPAPPSRCSSTPISPNRCHSIPEIRIAHVDDTPADKPRQRSSSMFSTISKTTEASKAGTLSSSKSATSTSLSGRALETSKNTKNPPQTQSTTKISGSVQVGRILPTPPNVGKGDSSSTSALPISVRNSAPTKFTSTVSPNRTRLARQPSQTDEPRVLSQTNKTIVCDIRKVSSTNTVDQTLSVPQKQAPDSDQRTTPQLHILNDGSVTHNEAYLYNRNRNLGSAIGTKVTNKVLDFSSTINKTKYIKENDASEVNTESVQKDEVVDFTNHKLKRLQEKQRMDSNVVDKTTVAVDLTKETEEDEAECLIPAIGPLQESPGVSILRTEAYRPDDRHSKSERSWLPPPTTTGTNQSNVAAPGKDAINVSLKPSMILSGGLSTSSASTIILSTATCSSVAHVSRKAHSLDRGLKQAVKTESMQPVQTSPLMRPVVKKEQGLQMPAVTTSLRRHVPADNKKDGFTSASYESSGMAEKYQRTAPANSFKATLDMSAKTTAQHSQQTVAPSKDPVCEALSLTRRKRFTSEEADVNPSHQDSLDLSYRGESPEPQGHTTEYIHLQLAEEHHSYTVTGNQVKCSDRKEISSGYRRALLPRQHPLLGQSSESLEMYKPPQQATAPATAPANTVKATLDMTSKCSSKLNEVVPQVRISDTLTEAIPLMRGKKSARELAQKDSVGVPLVVDISSHAPLCGVNNGSPAHAQQGVENKTLCFGESNLPQQSQQSKPDIFAKSNHTHPTFITSIMQPLVATAPANSIKCTLDMSIKACKSDTVPTSNYSDPVSLVRTRPSSYAYSQRDFVGIPLIVETHPPQEEPKRQQTMVGWQKQMQQGFVPTGSLEMDQRVSAPANSIRSFIDMSPRPPQKHSEIALDILSAGVVPLVKNKGTEKINDSVGVPLIVEQPVHQQARRALSGVNATNALHEQKSTYHNNDAFSGSGTTYNGMHQQNMPVDFSAKDNLNTTYISSHLNEPEDGQPMNFTNIKAKKEMSDRRQSGSQLEKQTLPGIVDLTVDPQNKPTGISNEDAKDCSYPHVSFLSQRSLNWEQQYIPPTNAEEIRVDTAISQTQKSLQFKESSTDKRAATQPGINCRRNSETGLNSVVYASSSSLMSLQIQPLQKWASGTMQDSTSLNYTYQHVTNVQAQFRKSDDFLPNTTELQTQHSVSQRQCQHPSVEMGWTASDAGYQLTPLNLQRQDTSAQHEKTPRPKILIKQATVDSCGSIEESPSETATITSNAESLPTFSTNNLCGKTETVPIPSLDVQSLSASTVQQVHNKPRTDHYPQCLGIQPGQSRTVTTSLQLSKQMDPNQSPSTAKQYPISTVSLGNMASSQCITDVTALISQPTTKHITMPVKEVESSLNQGCGVDMKGPQVPSAAEESTSVKGLISLFSGLGSHTSVSTKPVAVIPHDTYTQSVDNQKEIPPTQTPVIVGNVEGTTTPLSPVSKIPERNDLSLHMPVVSIVRSLPATPAHFSHQEDPASKLHNEDTQVLNRQSHPKSPAIHTRSSDSSPVITGSETESLPAKPSVTIPTEGNLSKGSSVDSSIILKKFISEANTKVATTDGMIISESETPQLENLPETDRTIIMESVSVNTGLNEASSVAHISQEKINLPKSIYIGINCPDMSPVDAEIEPGDLKPYIRLPHIFVSAASSPEDETNEHEQNLCAPSELSEFSASEEKPIAVTSASCKEALPADVAQSDLSKDAKTTEISSTEESEQVKSTAEYTKADKHNSKDALTRKSSITETILSESEINPETTETPTVNLSSMDRKSTVLDTTLHKLAKPVGDLGCQVGKTNLVVTSSEGFENIEVMTHEDKIKSSDFVLPEEIKSHDKLALMEVSSAPDTKSPEGVQDLAEKSEDFSQLSSVKPPSEETTTFKEDILAVEQPEVEQTHEQPGKGFFSMFSGSTATPQQTPSQTGLSILGGILPGSSTKETPGPGLLSMFGGSHAQSSTGPKDTLPPSTTQEQHGKGLLSMFGGSSIQSPPGPRGPTIGHMQPRGPPPKAPAGKSLFSMFATSAPQQPPSPRGHPGGNPTPRGPTVGSSLFGGILPSSTTQKETSAAGLFSKFGGLNAQPQTGPRMPTSAPTVTPPGPRASEPSGKGLFSMFGGQNQQVSESHLVASKSPDSEGIFKVSSVFSLGGTSDGNKSKTGFGFFGKSFLEQTKTEPENVPVKEEIALKQEKAPDKKTIENLVEANDNVPSQTDSSVKVEQACKDGQYSTTENSVPITHLELEVEKEATMKHINNESTSVAIEGSIADTPNVTSILPEKDALLDQLVHWEQSYVEKEASELETDSENKSMCDEIVVAAITSLSEKTDVMQEPESVLDSTDKGVVRAEHMKWEAEGDISVPAVEKQTEEPLKAVSNVENITDEPLKVINEEQVTAVDMEKPTEEPFEGADKLKATVADVEKTIEKPLEVAGKEQPVDENVTKEPLKIVDGKQADVGKSADKGTLAELVIAVKESTAESEVGQESETKENVEEALKSISDYTTKIAVTESTAESKVGQESETQKIVEEALESTSDYTTNIAVTESTAESEVGLESETQKIVDEALESKEPTNANLELEGTRSEPACGSEKSFETTSSFAVVSIKDEEIVGTVLPEKMSSLLSLRPASPPSQPRPSMARAPVSPGQRIGMPRIGGPQMGGQRMAGPRMTGPRQPVPQKPPDTASFSGFMSMFSTPNASNKSPNVGGFFSSSPGSFFGSSPASRQPQQQPQQPQKSSFFGLTNSIATDSLTSELFGIFKGPETTKSGEPQQSSTESGQMDSSASAVTVSKSTEKMDTDTHLPGDGAVKSADDSEVPEKGLVEEAERADKSEAEESFLTKSTTKSTTVFSEKGAETGAHDDNLESKHSAPSAPETKGMFEIPTLTASKFGFMSAATEGTSSIGSLFSSTSSPSTKTQQPQQVDGGLFSGLKTLSAGIFQDEKPTGNREASSASSVFGMKLGSVFGNSDALKSAPPVVTDQPQVQSSKPADELCEPELEKLSPGSEDTESADVSDTDGPTETSKTGSCETLAQSLQSGHPSLSVSLAEGLGKPELEITPCQEDETEVDTVHADLGTGQVKDLLTKEAAIRLVQFL